MSAQAASGGAVPAAARLWSELQHSTGRCFDDYLGASSRHRTEAQARLLRALELRWKLEEQVLLPALHESHVSTQEDAKAIAEEIDLLRELAEVVSEGNLHASASIAIVGALEGIDALRSTRIEHALRDAEAASRIDSAALAREMTGLLSRWRSEVAAENDGEDEEADPVGRPPR